MLFTACNKDDGFSESFGILNPQTPQGVDVKLTYPDGKEVSFKSDRVIGWDKGQLLEGNYFRQLRSSKDNNILHIKFNIPKDLDADTTIDGGHSLRPNRLLLQQTQSLGSLQPELFFNSINDPKEFNNQKNAIGTIIAHVGKNNYDIIVEIDATIVNNNRENIKIKGSIWKKNANK